MGIGYRLRGAETVDRARGDAQRGPAKGVRVSAVGLRRRLGVCLGWRGVDSRHRGARTGLEGVEAKNRVGRQSRMVSSGRVEGCAVKRYVGAGELDSGTTRDDMQGAAFALGA